MKNRSKYLFLILLLGGIGITAFTYMSPNITPKGETPDNQDPTLIRLAEASLDSEVSLEETLAERRSIRSYQNKPLDLDQVSQLLWAAQGISEPSRSFRTAPSAGALYPLEVYIVAGNIAGLPAGVYRYIPEQHVLAQALEGDKRQELFDVSLRQSSVRDAAGVLVFTAIYERTTRRYGERGIRYVHMEVGHASQNVYLQTVSLGLGTVVIGAFDDKGVKGVLNLSEQEEPLYIMPIGVP